MYSDCRIPTPLNTWPPQYPSDAKSFQLLTLGPLTWRGDYNQESWASHLSAGRKQFKCQGTWGSSYLLGPGSIWHVINEWVTGSSCVLHTGASGEMEVPLGTPLPGVPLKLRPGRSPPPDQASQQPRSAHMRRLGTGPHEHSPGTPFTGQCEGRRERTPSLRLRSFTHVSVPPSAPSSFVVGNYRSPTRPGC